MTLLRGKKRFKKSQWWKREKGKIYKKERIYMSKEERKRFWRR